MISVNVLEKLRFYVSFACTFAFAERSLMEGNAKLIRLIARDEHLHGQGTQFMLNKMMSGAEGEMMQRVAERCKDKALAIFDEAVKQEKVWADYLFQHGSMLGLNSTILGQFVDFMADQSLAGLGYEKRYGSTTTPLPWMGNYLNSDNVQVAPQESEISSYLVGQIDSEVSEDDFADMEL
jgi:ribonucleoside-diphosphate reductase beta chain